MFKFSPKDDRFYDLFVLLAKRIHTSGEMLRNFIYEPADGEDKVKEIKAAEVKCNQTLQRIFKELNKTFITPIDREDIYIIGKRMDDIADDIEAAANRFNMFQIKRATSEAKGISDLVVKSTAQVICLIKEFKVVHQNQNLQKIIVEINRLEEEAEVVFRKALGGLFSASIPTIEVIKWKETYERLRNILEVCKNVADTVEGVIIKHA